MKYTILTYVYVYQHFLSNWENVINWLLMDLFLLFIYFFLFYSYIGLLTHFIVQTTPIAIVRPYQYSKILNSQVKR